MDENLVIVVTWRMTLGSFTSIALVAFAFSAGHSIADDKMHAGNGPRPVLAEEPDRQRAFPCMPEAFAGAVTIILSPEIHSTAFAKTQLTKHFESAKAGIEKLVIEHTLESQVKPEKNFPGVEFTKNADGDVAWSFYILYKLRWKTKEADLKYASLLNALASEPMQETLKGFSRPLLNKRNEQALNDVKIIRDSLRTKKPPPAAFVARARESWSKRDAHLLLDLIYQAHFKRFQNQATDPLAPDSKTLEPKHGAAIGPEIAAWRNRNLASGAAVAACERGSGTIRLHMGISHVADTHRILKEMIARSGLEGKVRLKLDKSVLDDPEIAKITASTDAEYRRDFESARTSMLKIVE